MDREMLFRGKRLNNGEWVCGNLIQMDSEGSQSFIFPFYKYASSLTCAQIVSMFMVAVDSATVGQFTGLCDKNGKKIFEGDVCKDRIGEFIVKCDSENARFLGFYLPTVARDTRICYVGRFPPVEVIGNIHDNPELVKEEE